MQGIEDNMSPEDTTVFRFATGALRYLGRNTRPTLAHAVLVLTRSMSKPGPRTRAKLKRVLRYLKEATFMGIVFNAGIKDDYGDLEAYVDADHAGDKTKHFRQLDFFIFCRRTANLGFEAANSCGYTS